MCPSADFTCEDTRNGDDYGVRYELNAGRNDRGSPNLLCQSQARKHISRVDGERTHALEELREKEVDRHKHERVAKGANNKKGRGPNLHHSLISAESPTRAYSWNDGVTLSGEVVHKRGYKNHHPSNDYTVSRGRTKASIGRARETDHYKCYSSNDQTSAASVQ